RIVVPADELRHLRLELEGAGAGKEIVHLAGAVLKGQLDVIEPRALERADALLGHADARGDEIHIEAEPMRLGRHRPQVPRAPPGRRRPGARAARAAGAAPGARPPTPPRGGTPGRGGGRPGGFTQTPGAGGRGEEPRPPPPGGGPPPGFPAPPPRVNPPRAA